MLQPQMESATALHDQTHFLEQLHTTFTLSRTNTDCKQPPVSSGQVLPVS